MLVVYYTRKTSDPLGEDLPSHSMLFGHKRPIAMYVVNLCTLVGHSP